MFSNYKNTQTGKALIGISPHGSGILFSDIYTGSISGSEKDHDIICDRGFSIQELCAVKGVMLNRPKQKENNQFAEADIATTFDITATRIHVENLLGEYVTGAF